MDPLAADHGPLDGNVDDLERIDLLRIFT